MTLEEGLRNEIKYYIDNFDNLLHVYTGNLERIEQALKRVLINLGAVYPRVIVVAVGEGEYSVGIDYCVNGERRKLWSDTVKATDIDLVYRPETPEQKYRRDLMKEL